MKDKPRIGTTEYDRVQVYNSNYAPSGPRIAHFVQPWTAVGGPIDIFNTFATHAEALEWALQEAEKR